MDPDMSVRRGLRIAQGVHGHLRVPGRAEFRSSDSDLVLHVLAK